MSSKSQSAELSARNKDKEFHYLNPTEEKVSNYKDNLLKKGPKYILDNDINMKVTIPKMEEIIEKMPKLEHNIVRGKIQGIISKKIKENGTDSEDRKELNKLKKRKDTAFLKTDKTGKIVMMPRKDYVKKMIETIEGMKVKRP